MKTTQTIQSILDSGHDAEQAPAVLALCQHLDCDPDGISLQRHDHYGLDVYETPSGEYAIGTDSQADEATTANIRDSLWAFNASFIVSMCELPDELEDGIRAAQEKQCESANDWLLPMVEKQCGLPDFVEQAIAADGRGHFMSSYDGEENEETVKDGMGEDLTLYIYRIN